MLGKINRFTKHHFARTRPKMKIFRTGDFLFCYSLNKKNINLAAVVSKKVSKKAVERNYYRRKMYELFKDEELNSFPGLNLIAYYRGSSIKRNDLLYETAIKNLKKFLIKQQNKTKI